MMIKKCLVFFLCFFSLTGWSQDRKHTWVDSVFNKLDVEQKIGQLFFVKVAMNASPQQLKEVIDLAEEGKIGGVIQLRLALGKHVTWAEQLQRNAKTPVLIAASVTAGLGTVLDSTMNFYRPLVLGALENDSLIKAYGEELAFQMKTADIQLNLGSSSYEFFNDNPQKNISKTSLFLDALNQRGILSGSVWPSAADSSLSQTRETTASKLSVIQFSLQNALRIDEINVSNVRKKLSYEGMLMADVNELQKFSSKKKKGDAETIGFLAGFDLMVSPLNIEAAVKQIKKIVKKDKQLALQLDQSVRRILSYKYQSGLNEITTSDNIGLKLNSPEARLLRQTIANEAVTVVQNKNALIPIQKLDDTKFISISVGKNSFNPLTSYLTRYAPFSHFQLGILKDTINFPTNFTSNDIVVIGLFSNSIPQDDLATYVNRLSDKAKVIVCSFDNPQGLKYFESASAIIAAYADDAEMMQTVAQIIFGGLPAKGSLPIKVSGALVNGTKVSTELSNRFSYQQPEAAGMDSRVLEKIELIAKEAIDIGSTPGCYVQVVKDGKVIYDRGFGWLTYEKKSPVTEQTIYDLASVTKVTATLQTVMYMYERGMIDVHKKLSVYLPELKESNKADFTIKDILTHQAGLWPFLPFWAETVKDSAVIKKYYARQSSDDFPFPVAENLFASKAMKDSLWQWIIHAKIREKVSRTPFDYRYSDMGFYMMQHLAEKLLGMPIEDFLQKNLYQPIGANTMGYLPLRKFPKEMIAPTEDDKLFRKELLVGYVHDQGAAMHGGIAGHAGLFSNANDLAKMGQLWLNGGSYGGVKFLKSETLATFTQKQYEISRRGLGWDRPTISDWNGPTTLHASAKTFGHTGFTGTCVWVDPEFNLVYVFLSNRVNPDMTNNKILNANIRPRIQEVIYQSIFEYCSRNRE